MRWSGLHFFPHPPWLVLAAGVVIALVGVLLRFVLADYAFQRLGLSHRGAILLLGASLLGSSINVPVAELPGEYVEHDTVVRAFGLVYVVPGVIERHTLLAVNLGGAVIPVLFVGYLLLRFGFHWRMLVAVALATFLAHSLARPIQGVGIALPPLVVALAAAAMGLILDRWTAPCTAYVAGTLGTLIGADLLNLGALNHAAAPVVSVGGAGTFDGVFVTGLLAVLLTGIRFGKLPVQPPSNQQVPGPPMAG